MNARQWGKSTGRVCCVPGCRNNQRDNRDIKFYSFPDRDYEVQRKKNWIARVRRQGTKDGPWIPTKETKICSAHFVGAEKSNDPRKENYNPTIFPWKPESAITADRARRIQKRNEKKDEQLTNEDSSEQTMSRYGRCSIVGCVDTTKSKRRLFRFPAATNTRGELDPVKEKRRQLWLNAIGTHNIRGQVKYPRICDQHFITGHPVDIPGHVDYFPSKNIGTHLLPRSGARKPGRKRKQSHDEDNELSEQKRDRSDSELNNSDKDGDVTNRFEFVNIAPNEEVFIKEEPIEEFRIKEELVDELSEEIITKKECIEGPSEEIVIKKERIDGPSEEIVVKEEQPDDYPNDSEVYDNLQLHMKCEVEEEKFHIPDQST